MAESWKVDQLLNQLAFQNRNRVKTDVTNLTATYRTLNLKLGTLIQNNGAALKVLDFEGTIPVVYCGTQYNIPIQMYLTEAYPQVPPQIYVRPTSNMVIKPNHKNVDAEGLVYLPYLFNWNPNSSTLRELVLIMCGVFGQEPPLFSRVGQASLQPQAVQATSINNSPAPLSASRPNSSQYDKFLSPSIHAASPPSYAAATATSAGVQLPIPEHLKEQQTQRDKERLLRDVTSQLHEAIIMTQTRLKGEIDEDLQTQFELSLSRERVEQARRDIISLHERFQSAIESIKEKDQALDKWTTQKAKELQEANGIVDTSVESKWIPYDDLTVQLVRLQADYLALDDAMYYLDRALANHSNRTVDLNVFLRETRKLAREQFLCKAHMRKIQNQISLSYR